MNPMLFTLFLLLILPAILWAVPRTRRMTGSWIAALKSVPAGCAVMIALPAFLLVLIRELPHRLRGMISSPLTDLIVSLMGIIAGIALIVFLLRFIYRKFHAEGKRSPLPAVIVFLFFGIAFPILSCVYMVISYQTAMINYQTACDSGKRYYSLIGENMNFRRKTARKSRSKSAASIPSWRNTITGCGLKKTANAVTIGFLPIAAVGHISSSIA